MTVLTRPSRRTQTLLSGALVAGALAAAPASAQLTLRVTVPQGTPPDAALYVAGSFNGWNPADARYRLNADATGAYVLTLHEAVRGPVEFKFTLGSWDTAETDATGADAPNRGFTVPQAGAATYTGAVTAWRDGSPRPARPSTATGSVSVLDTAFAMPQLGRTRRVWIYLPPDYATTDKTYPVLYMHDGQNVFDAATSFAGEWGVDETLDSLHAAGDWGAIVVAVDNGGQRRLDEYSPWPNARLSAGGEGEAYVEFLARTLKPYIDARFRTRPDPANTGVAGSSMGGLISLYAALRHPDVFGRAGVFSPALWFAPALYETAGEARPAHPAPRFYFVTGAREGDAPEVYTRDHRRMVDTLASRGYRPGEQMAEFIRDDGTHSEWFWRREFPAAYRWLFSDAAPCP